MISPLNPIMACFFTYRETFSTDVVQENPTNFLQMTNLIDSLKFTSKMAKKTHTVVPVETPLLSANDVDSLGRNLVLKMTQNHAQRRIFRVHYHNVSTHGRKLTHLPSKCCIFH